MEENKKVKRHKKSTESSADIRQTETGWAWMVLLGGFVCRCLTDGLLTSLGVFIIAWKDYFAGSLTQLTWIASLLAGITYIVGPLGSALLKRFSIRQVVMAGAILTSTSFIAASFATQLWHLYITSTVAGMGLGLSYQPSFVILTYYFDKRLGRVSGLASTGSACGMLIIPPLFHKLISYYSWKGAILILAGFVGNIGVCAALYRPNNLEIRTRTRVKPQDNPSDSTNKNGRIKNILSSIIEHGDFILFKDIYFIFLLVAYFLYGFSFVIAFHYLSARAVHTGTSEEHAAYLLSSIGIGSCVSRLTHGFIIDHHILTATILTSLSYLLCGISCIMTPLSDKYLLLATWAVLIGLASGVYHSTTPTIAKEYVGLDHVSGAMGWMLLTCGIGVILGSYLTGILVDATGNYDFPFYLAGICFMVCALFTSAKPLIENLKHIYRIMMRRTQKGTQETYMKGVINRGSQTDDSELKRTQASDSICLSHHVKSEHSSNISSLCVVNEDETIKGDSFI